MDDKQFLNQLFADIDATEVLTIFFPLWHKALIVDTRRRADAGPYVEGGPAVGSIEERLARIQHDHPTLGPVATILSIPWIKSVAALRDGGIFERLVARLRVAGLPEEDARAACSAAQRSLLAAERKATLALIRGEGYIDWQPGI